MTAVARDSAPFDVCIESTTSSRAAPLITNTQELAYSAEALLEMFDAGLDPLDGVIVSAFGDPGVEELRARLKVPVTGIAEASLQEAATHGSFAICTTTPQLVDAMRMKAAALRLQDALACVLVTRETPRELMTDAAAIDCALADLVETAKDDYGASAVVIGGGPLARSARRLAPLSPVPLIEPVSAAVRRLRAELIGS
jgi:Asp/Glu/hydantoin racemase